MTAAEVVYTVPVRLIREVIFAEPDEAGKQATSAIPLADVEDDAGALDLAAVVERMPVKAWGWFTQERFGTEVDHDGRTFMLTSLPVSQSGTTFYQARYVERGELQEMIDAQEKYRTKCRRQNRPIGALPHGRDKRPLMTAFVKGEAVIVTRTGNYRFFDTDRDALYE